LTPARFSGPCRFAILNTKQLRVPLKCCQAEAAVATELTRKSMFELLPETPAIYPVWESLVIQYRVFGKPAHDARLVAAMKVHGLTAILTFDKTGFSRYAGIEVVHPVAIA
jgi:predicted nucleic acid-binding protein